MQRNGDNRFAPAADIPKEKPKEPFTLLVYTNGVKKEEFDSRYKELLDKKFPHITIKYVQAAKGSLRGSWRKSSSRKSTKPKANKLHREEGTQ